MPVNFLSDAERERWQCFPGTVPQDDLHAFFLLTDSDKQASSQGLYSELL